jgi:hypothetical protein
MRGIRGAVLLAASLAASAFLTARVAGAEETSLIDATNIDAIVNLAKGYGAATKGKTSDGDPKITGKINGVGYIIFFLGCSDSHSDCKSIQFYAGWDTKDVKIATINKWNSENRFGRAYLDDSSNPAIEMDVNLDYGVSSENLDDTMDYWRLVLDEFVKSVVNAD